MSLLRDRFARRIPPALFVLAVGVVVLALPASVVAGGGGTNQPQTTIKTASDAAMDKLDSTLEQKVESGSTADVNVFVTMKGNAAEVRGLLAEDRIAAVRGVSIVIGQTSVQALPKLASFKGVVSVGPVDLRKTGSPLGAPDPELAMHHNEQQINAALEGLYKREVPFSKAPRLKGSNFEKLKRLAVLDARTHDFARAWNDGFTGKGVTVGVMDGGTDFGHPDLIGTWQTWSNAPDPGWNGWPKAFDPFGVAQWILAPGQIGQGLSWYTLTSSRTCALSGSGWKQKCTVNFATRTGPSRNFNAPSGTVAHDYTFPAKWSKSGTVRLGSHPDDHLLDLFNERPAFLVTDPKTAGVYDTVYVDLDADFDFSDEKPATKSSPVSYRDMDGDGYTDISGGLLYYISDGVTSVPGGIDVFGGVNGTGPDGNLFAPGQLLAWSGDYDPAIGGHGTQTASNIVGQGVINGMAPCFSDLRNRSGAVSCKSGSGSSGHKHGDDDDDGRRGGTYPGAVIGGAPHAKLAPYGDIYFNFDLSIQIGYLLSTISGVDITSNSYGDSAVDNDGYDAASQEADLLHAGGTTTPMFSTGNGAPGFGTTAPPSPSAGIAVGASTQFGGTGWDSIDRISQVVDNETMVWSNRGPGATGSAGQDVLADGAYSAGDITLNTVLNGKNSWLTWGGTSRSTPVAVGATALIYQAYRKSNPGPLPAGFYETAKEILKSSAKDLEYDAMIQGAGSVDADDAVEAALGKRASVSPSEWRAGDYRGTEYPVFAHTMAPGGSDSQTFTIDGPGRWQLSDRMMTRTATESFSFSSSNVANESPYNFNAPDYLRDLSGMIRENKDADLMVVRVNYPRAQFDPNGDYANDQSWRTLLYSWTDIDRDDRLWRDRDGDGAVDKTILTTSSNIDGFLDVDFRNSEIDKGEYVRFMYHNAVTNSFQGFLRDPWEAVKDADGVFLGLQHQIRSNAIPVTDFEVQVDFYENTNWSWISTPSSARDSFTATINVPPSTPFGMYSGAIQLRRDGDTMIVPVMVAVAATATQNAAGQITGSLKFGGPAVEAAQRNLLYNNGSVFGANDWGWRAESGDWRFFYYDVPQTPAPGSLFLTRTRWQDTAPFTDLDTLIFGRSANTFQLFGGSPVFGAPYILDTVGGSPNTNVGAGVWTFDTATGGAEDVVTAPAQAGLHAAVLHQVGWHGGQFHAPFDVEVAGASVSPTEVNVSTATGTGSFDVTFTSGLPLEGVTGEAFGLSQPVTTNEVVSQDDPGDPSSASVKKNVTLNHAGRLTVETVLNDDIDVFVVRDENGDGMFTNAEIVAASAGATGDEFIEITRPEDGNYQVWLQGFAVAGNPTAQLTIDALQGNDMTVNVSPSGPVAAGTPVTLTVNFNKPGMVNGQDYFGLLTLGPTSAPSALSVPIKVTKTP